MILPQSTDAKAPRQTFNIPSLAMPGHVLTVKRLDPTERPLSVSDKHFLTMAHVACDRSVVLVNEALTPPTRFLAAARVYNKDEARGRVAARKPSLTCDDCVWPSDRDLELHRTLFHRPGLPRFHSSDGVTNPQPVPKTSTDEEGPKTPGPSRAPSPQAKQEA